MRGEFRRNATAWIAEKSKAEWAELAVERQEEIERLRTALISIQNFCAYGTGGRDEIIRRADLALYGVDEEISETPGEETQSVSNRTSRTPEKE